MAVCNMGHIGMADRATIVVDAHLNAPMGLGAVGKFCAVTQTHH